MKNVILALVVTLALTSCSGAFQLGKPNIDDAEFTKRVANIVNPALEKLNSQDKALEAAIRGKKEDK